MDVEELLKQGTGPSGAVKDHDILWWLSENLFLPEFDRSASSFVGVIDLPQRAHPEEVERAKEMFYTDFGTVSLVPYVVLGPVDERHKLLYIFENPLYDFKDDFEESF